MGVDLERLVRAHEIGLLCERGCPSDSFTQLTIYVAELIVWVRDGLAPIPITLIIRLLYWSGESLHAFSFN
jgi:hypothetical protein